MEEVNRSPARRSLLHLVLLALFSLALVLASAAPGRAEGRPLEFSQDGVHWTSEPPKALFRDDVVLAPGGSATATLHLRSIAPTPGVLKVSLTNVRISAEEAGRAFRLGAVTDAGSGVDGAGEGLPRTRFAELAENTPVGRPLTLAPGQSTRFLLTVDLEPTPEDPGAQATAISLDLAITFRDAAAAGTDGAVTPSPPPPVLTIPAVAPDAGHLLGTGAAAAPVLHADESTAPYRGLLALTGVTRTVVLVAASMLIVGGLLLLTLRRKERDEHTQPAPLP